MGKKIKKTKSKKAPPKMYRVGKTRLDVFTNKTKSGKTYNIFKLYFYIFGKPKPTFLKKNNIWELQQILSKIKIKGYDKE